MTHNNSEKKIENPNFRLKIGTTNCVNPEIIYIEGKAFISPITDKSDYNEDIKEFKHFFKHRLQSLLNDNEKSFEKNRYIVQFDIATGGMMLNKKSFLTIQLLLRQKQLMKLKDVKIVATPMINSLINELSEKIREKNYTVTKTK